MVAPESSFWARSTPHRNPGKIGVELFIDQTLEVSEPNCPRYVRLLQAGEVLTYSISVAGVDVREIANS